MTPHAHAHANANANAPPSFRASAQSPRRLCPRREGRRSTPSGPADRRACGARANVGGKRGSNRAAVAPARTTRRRRHRHRMRAPPWHKSWWVGRLVGGWVFARKRTCVVAQQSSGVAGPRLRPRAATERRAAVMAVVRRLCCTVPLAGCPTGGLVRSRRGHTCQPHGQHTVSTRSAHVSTQKGTCLPTNR